MGIQPQKYETSWTNEPRNAEHMPVELEDVIQSKGMSYEGNVFLEPAGSVNPVLSTGVGNETQNQTDNEIETQNEEFFTDSDVESHEDATEELAEKVIDVLETYFWRSDSESGFGRAEWPGRTKFMGHVMHWIRLNKPVQMVLPSFPFKSSNPDKVLGVLPDFAEYLGLSRLNQVCIDVRKVYSLGAEITIATDGVAFSDLLLIGDTDVWNYGQAVKDMVESNFFDKQLKVVHAMEILELTGKDDLTEESFYRTSDQCRELIKDQFCQREEDIRRLVEADPDSRLTFAGFKKFCKDDLENSSIRKAASSRKAYLREMSTLALRMMARSEGFGLLIRARMPHHVRLSMHPSSGVAKLSICLVPQLPEFQARSPWMSCIAVDWKGTYQTAHVQDVRTTHEIIYQNGRPWLYRERTPLYQLPETKEEKWAIEHVFPSGLLVWPTIAAPQKSSSNHNKLQKVVRQRLSELAAWQPVNFMGAYLS